MKGYVRWSAVELNPIAVWSESAESRCGGGVDLQDRNLVLCFHRMSWALIQWNICDNQWNSHLAYTGGSWVDIHLSF